MDQVRRVLPLGHPVGDEEVEVVFSREEGAGFSCGTQDHHPMAPSLQHPFQRSSNARIIIHQEDGPLAAKLSERRGGRPGGLGPCWEAHGAEAPKNTTQLSRTTSPTPKRAPAPAKNSRPRPKTPGLRWSRYKIHEASAEKVRTHRRPVPRAGTSPGFERSGGAEGKFNGKGNGMTHPIPLHDDGSHFVLGEF